MLDINLKPDDFYQTLLLQFTYVSLYHGVLPLSSGVLCLSNLFLIFLTERMYSYITKRPLSEKMCNIGLWNDIFLAIGLLSIIGSAFITTYTTDSLDNYFNGSKEIALLVIIAAEHLVLGLRFLMSKIVNNMPRWVRNSLAYQEFMKESAELDENEFGFSRQNSSFGKLADMESDEFKSLIDFKKGNFKNI
jgi:hypothetical protein